MPRSRVRGFSARRARELRTELGLTPGELATVVGVSAATIRHWEAGAHAPGLGSALRLADVLGVTLAELVVLPPEDVHLADLRQLAGLYQGEAAESLGWSHPTLNAIETGARRPRDYQADQLAALYRVSREHLDAAVRSTAAHRRTVIDGKIRSIGDSSK